MKELPGINATLPELIRARPPKNLTGFSPSGRVSTHQWGNNSSIFKGRGMEFSESRVYQAGDDVRNIDWRVTARTGKAHTKLFQEERERPVQILLDLRAMMQFGTRTRFKSHLAAELAAQMAWVAHDGGDRFGGQILTRDGIVNFRSGRTRRTVLRFLEQVVIETTLRAHTTINHELSLATGIHRLRRLSRPGTLVFIISDFNDLNIDTAKQLTRLSGQAHITCIQVLDVLDGALPPNGGRLSNGEKAILLTALKRDDLTAYTTAFSQRQALLSKTCANNSIAYHLLQTTDSAKSILRSPKVRK
ncbi:MAG: DUF58 domain-containing protein [Ostreibacterium sp.]